MHPALFSPGMARCAVASRGLVHQLLSPTQEWDYRLPRSFEITDRRLRRTVDEMTADLRRAKAKYGVEWSD